MKAPCRSGLPACLSYVVWERIYAAESLVSLPPKSCLPQGFLAIREPISFAMHEDPLGFIAGRNRQSPAIYEAMACHAYLSQAIVRGSVAVI